MRVRSMLGRSTAPFALWLSVGGSVVACGSRDSIIGGPFGGEGEATTGGSSQRGGGAQTGGPSGHSTGGSVGGTHAEGGTVATGGSSDGGTSATGGSSVDDGGSANFPGGGDVGFGGSFAGASGSATAGNGLGGMTGGDAGNLTGGFSPGGNATGGATTGGSATAGFGGSSGFGNSGGTSAGVSGSGVGGATAGTSSGGTAGGIGHLGDACATNGVLACHGAAQRLKVLCDGNVWRSNGSCVESENCDQRSGVCALIIAECASRQPNQRFCKTNALGACGPDLVTADWLENCTGRCVESASSADCAPERCGDGRIQPGEGCDDGNTVDGDTCTNSCKKPVCGDGSLYTELEKCDDGNTLAGDSCSVVCGSDARSVGAGYYSTCALGVSGRVQCWGYNSNGQAGAGDTATRGSWTFDMGVNLPLVDFGTGKTAVALSVGYQSNCAILNDGSLKCWGYNYYGQLGIGDNATRGTAVNHMGDNLPAVSLGSGRSAFRVALGQFHTCAELDDGSLKCWGQNNYGQLGQGDIEIRGDVAGELGDALPPIDLGTSEPVQDLALGYNHTCAQLTSGVVKCWGSNLYGERGSGDGSSLGDAPGEMGDRLPTVDLGSGRTAIAIAAGDYHTCALLDDATVKCWGANYSGQLGLGDTLYRGDGPGEMGDSLPPVDLGPGRSAKAIAAGGYNTCAILDDDQVKCWGDNSYGALGIGDTNTHGDGPNEMGNYLPTVSLGTGRTAKAISVSASHVCALLDNSTIKCWGNNSYAQLGLGTGASASVGDGAGELGDSLPYVIVTF